MQGFTATGKAGELRWGYEVAARLGAWTMDRDRVEADAVETNAFYLEHPNARLSLWLRFGPKFWVWRSAEVVQAGSPMVVRVRGSAEVREAPGQ